jgi:hypothetical protein
VFTVAMTTSRRVQHCVSTNPCNRMQVFHNLIGLLTGMWLCSDAPGLTDLGVWLATISILSCSIWCLHTPSRSLPSILTEPPCKPFAATHILVFTLTFCSTVEPYCDAPFCVFVSPFWTLWSHWVLSQQN